MRQFEDYSKDIEIFLKNQTKVKEFNCMKLVLYLLGIPEVNEFRYLFYPDNLLKRFKEVKNLNKLDLGDLAIFFSEEKSRRENKYPMIDHIGLIYQKKPLEIFHKFCLGKYEIYQLKDFEKYTLEKKVHLKYFTEIKSF